MPFDPDVDFPRAVRCYLGPSIGWVMFPIEDIPGGTADNVIFTPVGGISSTNVQSAIAELDTEKVPSSRQVNGAGLATGGGDLTVDRTISVPKASMAQAQAGMDDTTAMTPLKTSQAISVTAVAKAGDTMTGPLILPGAPTTANQAATKAYVDSAPGIPGPPGPTGPAGATGPQGPPGPAGSGAGDMLRANNLSDVASAPTSFDNIKQQATNAYVGATRYATDVEATAIALTNVALTPHHLALMTPSTTTGGMMRAATDAEAQAKTLTNVAVSPGNMAALTGNTTPLMNGTANGGSSPRFSHDDHVHPSDTSRAPTASPTFTGTVTLPTLKVTASALFGPNQLTQYNAIVSVRYAVAGAADFEWGHNNPAGYGSTLGCEPGSGAPFISLNCGPGTTGGTYKTLGLPGAIIRSDNAGGIQFGTVGNANADNQSFQSLMALSGTSGLLSGICLATAAQYRANSRAAVLPVDQVWSAAAQNTQSVSGTITLDFSAGINFHLVVTAINCTLANPTNAKAGQSGTIVIYNGVGGTTISTWGNAWKFPGGVKPTPSPGGGTYDVLSYVVANDSTTLFCTYQNGFA